LNHLRQKLNTIAASDQDEIVVVVRKDQLGMYREEVRTEFPEAVGDIESLDGETNSLASQVESNFDSVNIEFKSYKQVSE